MIEFSRKKPTKAGIYFYRPRSSGAASAVRIAEGYMEVDEDECIPIPTKAEWIGPVRELDKAILHPETGELLGLKSEKKGRSIYKRVDERIR